jgi:hypothetical protein
MSTPSTPTIDTCPHPAPPLLGTPDNGVSWTATCKLGCGLRVGTYDPGVVAPAHWTPFLPAEQDPPSKPADTVRDRTLLLLRVIRALSSPADTDARTAAAAYAEGSRDAAMSAALRLDGLYAELAYATAQDQIDEAHAPLPAASTLIHSATLAADLLSLSMVSPDPGDTDYTIAFRTLRAQLTALVIEHGGSAADRRLAGALTDAGW